MANLLKTLGLWMALSVVLSLLIGCGPTEEQPANTSSAEQSTIRSIPPTPDWIEAPSEEPVPEQETVAQAAPTQAEQAPAQPPPKPSEWRGVGKNILHNSGFEQTSSRPFAWWIEDRNPGGVVVSAETDGPYAGERSVKVELPANVIVGVFQGVTGLKPGKAYFVSGYIKTENYMGNARIEVHDARGYKVFARGSQSVTGTQDWTGLQVDFTVPEDTEKLNIILRGQGDRDSLDTSGSIWFDNVKLYRADDGSAN